jgi:multiple antibiotic resistance protein
MGGALQSFLLAFSALFSIVNPIGSAPIFLALTANHSDRVRRALARRVAVYGFILLLVLFLFPTGAAGLLRAGLRLLDRRVKLRGDDVAPQLSSTRREA